jgi:hypothetical protein
MLLGTRWGLEGAFVAVKKLADGSDALPPGALAIFDKIFGETNEFIKNPGEDMTPEKMMRVAAEENETL